MKKITNARSKKNGVVFYSNTMPDLAVNAFIDENGKIQALVTPRILTNMVDLFFDDEKEPKKTFFNWIFVTLFEIFLFILLSVLFRNIYLSTALIYAYLNFPCWFKVIHKAYEFKLGKKREVSHFHAAEHMSVNAYCKLQRVPTLEEIKASSRFSQFCSSMPLLEKTVSSLLFTLCIISGIFVNPLIYVCLFTFTLLLVLVLQKFHLPKYLQILFTSKPTDLELEVALKGIQVYDDMENQIQQGKVEISIPDSFSIFFF